MALAAALLSVAATAAGAVEFDVGTPVSPWGVTSLDCATNISFIGSACNCTTSLQGAYVVIDGPEDVDDSLSCAGCLVSGIGSSFDRGILTLEGAATLDDYLAALRSVEFLTTNWQRPQVTLRASLGHGLRDPSTGHFYLYRPWPTVSEDWGVAQAAAAATGNDLLGLTGYLATLGTAGELDFVEALIDGVPGAQGFIGGSDYGEEGVYRWITGPEGCPPYNAASADAGLRSGCVIETCDAVPPPAGCLSGTPFGTGASAREGPDPSTEADDYLVLEEGKWEDVDGATPPATVTGYFVEWGGVGDLCVADSSTHWSSVLDAQVNECTAACPTCANATCTSAGHGCHDEDISALSTDTWYCTVDECAAACATCANTTCFDMQQTCDDKDINAASLRDWECVCGEYQTGRNRSGPASCTTDECSVQGCPTCANSTCADAEPGPQWCEETDTAANVLADWLCHCDTVFMTGSAVAGPALCRIDECTVQYCATCANSTCLDAEQQCVEGDLAFNSTGDWVCKCTTMHTQGNRTAGVAVCLTDECVEACPTCANATCSAEMQSCSDTNKALDVLSNWQCSCVAPAVGGKGEAAAAQCSLNECWQDCPTCEDGACSNSTPPQNCVDAIRVYTGALNSDWRCDCVSPREGSSRGAVAVCLLDECSSGCATCANATCAASNQTCDDPDNSTASTGDWACKCVPPLTGRQVRAAAPCSIDECTAQCPSCAGSTCSDVGQGCSDVNKASNSLYSWQCECVSPATGPPRRRAPAPCSLDECTVTCPSCANGTCAAQGKVCIDNEKLSLGSWVCDDSTDPPTPVPEPSSNGGTSVFDPQGATGEPSGAGSDEDDGIGSLWFVLLGFVALCMICLIAWYLLQKKNDVSLVNDDVQRKSPMEMPQAPLEDEPMYPVVHPRHLHSPMGGSRDNFNFPDASIASSTSPTRVTGLPLMPYDRSRSASPPAPPIRSRTLQSLSAGSAGRSANHDLQSANSSVFGALLPGRYQIGSPGKPKRARSRGDLSV
eukprot:TRINITY_DN14437_c0_g1_i1.p1 TRINITY_DN14437_c0_g1~~TRINITY_DN14437_c0_g1_i1.p1  ORF type:complete len:1012 (+),score=72.37 TRINITY_DN14437_c0_g1_i1:92-3127(+)